MGSAAVQIRGLRVVRGPTVALDGLDLDLRAGALTGLLGPSGSGKTTLLRAVLGLQLTEAGEVTVLGRPAGSADLRRRIGYVTQAPSVYGDLTVAENLDYLARVLRVERTGGRGTADVLEIVGLTARRHQVVATLSGGERSRVTLAAALLGSPELLVLDEPTVGLDPVLREDLWTVFAELARAGTTLVVSSHVMDEAERCEDLVLLRDGRVLAAGTLPELLAATGQPDAERAFLALVRGTA